VNHILTQRQAEVATHLCVGLTNREIGARLGVSEKTVKSYLTEIFGKLQVRNRVEAVLALQKSNP
jgi:DNA-binding NarL/FixJ family response regulator